MTNEEAIKYLIPPIATSTEPSAEYLKQKEAYELAIKKLEQLMGIPDIVFNQIKQGEHKAGEWLNCIEHSIKNGTPCDEVETRKQTMTWKTEVIEVRKYYAVCPFCEFSFEMDNHRELPYFCGCCGKRLRGDENV